MVARPFWWRMPQIDLSAGLTTMSPMRASREQHPLAAGIDIDRHEVAERVIVLGVIGCAGLLGSKATLVTL